MNYLYHELYFHYIKEELQIELEQYIERYQIAFQNIYRNVNNMIKQHVHTDVTTDQFTILQVIVQHERITSTEIAQTLGVGKSAITALVNRLVEKQLIERQRNEKDRRIVYLHVTDEGKKIVKETEAEIHRFISDKLQHFPIAEIEGFLLAMEKLAKLMDEGENE